MLRKGTRNLDLLRSQRNSAKLTSKILENLSVDGSFSRGALATQALKDGKSLNDGALATMFREGTSDDLNELLYAMPDLLRYLKAGSHIVEYQNKIVSLKNQGVTGSSDSEQCLEGAILVSKLFYDAKKAQGLESQITDGFETLVTAVEDKLEIAALAQGGVDVVDMRTLDKIKAYNLVLKERETQRLYQHESEDDRIVHLVDQILDQENAYSFALPISHSIVFNEVMRRVGVKAVGVAFPRVFMSRIVSQEETASDAAPTITAAASKVPLYVPLHEIEGVYVSHFPAGMQEIHIRGNLATGHLEAVKLDGDDYVPRGEISWKTELPPVEPSTVDEDGSVRPQGRYLPVGKVLKGELQVAKEGFTGAQLVPCTVEVIAMSRSDVVPFDKKGGPCHYEVKVNLDLDYSMPLINSNGSGSHHLSNSNHGNDDDEEEARRPRSGTGAERQEDNGIVDGLVYSTSDKNGNGSSSEPVYGTVVAVDEDSMEVDVMHFELSDSDDVVAGNLEDLAGYDEEGREDPFSFNSGLESAHEVDMDLEMVNDPYDEVERNSRRNPAGSPSFSSSLSSLSLNFVKTHELHTCLFCVDSGTATTGPVTPEQYSVLLARHRAYDENGLPRVAADADADAGADDETSAGAAANPLSLLSADVATDSVNSDGSGSGSVRDYTEAALAPAGVSAVVHRMIQNIRVYFEGDSGGGIHQHHHDMDDDHDVDDARWASNERYWSAMGDYFEAMDLLDQEEERVKKERQQNTQREEFEGEVMIGASSSSSPSSKKKGKMAAKLSN
jgi:hypothetical protein